MQNILLACLLSAFVVAPAEDHVVDGLVERAIHEALKVTYYDHADLERATFGKSRLLAAHTSGHQQFVPPNRRQMRSAALRARTHWSAQRKPVVTTMRCGATSSITAVAEHTSSDPDSSVQWDFVDGALVSTPGRLLPQYHMEDVEQHKTKASCWTVVGGRVLNLTKFLEHHPGGSGTLLKWGGKDSTEFFKEVHIPASQYREFVEGLTIGTLEGARADPEIVTQHSRSAAPIEHFYMTQLDSAFPAERFYGSGLETFRWEWAIRDQMIAASTDHKPVDDIQATRSKSKIAPLIDEQDWFQLGDPREYATQMKIREKLLLSNESRSMVYIVDQDNEALGAAQELLDMMLEWLPRYHPDRFSYDRINNQVHTLAPGYVRCFNISDFERQPLLLCALLVQEDLFFLAEQSLEEAPEEVDGKKHKNSHPSGVHHMLRLGVSCFTFDYREKHGLPMTRIHHPFVPGFEKQLQRNMNKLFTGMNDDRIWYRHNYAFESDQVYHCVTFDKPWAKFVVPSELMKKKSSAEVKKTSVNASAASSASAFNPGAGIDQDKLSSAEAYDYIDGKLQLHVEFQTLRRLPKSGHTLFTVRTYYDRIAGLKKAPGCAQALAAAMRRKYKGIYRYQNLDRTTSMQAVIGYLDNITSQAGLIPGPAIPAPWDRNDMKDGTAKSDPEREVYLKEARSWQQKGFERARCPFGFH